MRLTNRNETPIWNDFYHAVRNAHDALCTLSNFGMCIYEPELREAVGAAKEELAMWDRGLSLLRDSDIQDVNRDVVKEAYDKNNAELLRLFGMEEQQTE